MTVRPGGLDRRTGVADVIAALRSYRRSGTVDAAEYLKPHVARSVKAYIAVQQFALFFLIQFVNYGLICLKTRAIANAWIRTLVASDMAIAGLNFKVIKKIADSESHAALLGYTIGGACGSVVSVLLSKWIFGQ